MSRIIFLPVTILMFWCSSGFSQANGGCDPSADCQVDETKIIQVTIGNNTYTNDTCIYGVGYWDYSAENFFYAKAGQNLYGEVHWTEFWNYRANIWIDWNGNNDFTDAGEDYDIIGVDQSTYGNGNIAVPETVTEGDTLLVRVGVVYNLEELQDPCGENPLYFSQEFEDYSIIIGEDPNAPTGSYCASYSEAKESPMSNNSCNDSLTNNDTQINRVEFVSQWDNPNNDCSTDSMQRGYSDYTKDFTTYLKDGDGFEINVELETEYSNNIYRPYTDCQAWIDWNGDGIFDEGVEEIVTKTGTITDLNFTFSGTVDSNLTQGYIGVSRLRVKGFWHYVNNTYFVCGPYAFGETEDYLVLIGDVVRCAELPTPDNSTICTNETEFTWEAPSTGPAPDGYYFYLGTDVDATNLVNGINVGAVQSYTHPSDFVAGTTYYWKVVAYDANGEAFGCTINTFDTYGIPAPSIDDIQLDGQSTDNGSVCADTDLMVNATSSNGSGMVNYIWTGSGSGFLNDANTLNPIFNSNSEDNTFTLIISATDDNQCAVTDSVQVYVKPLPVKGTIDASKTEVCPEETTTLSVSGHTGMVSDWETKIGTDSFVSTGNMGSSWSTTITEATTFKAILNLDGCITESDEVEVILNPTPPTATILVDPSNEVCEGETVSLTSTISNDIIWNDVDGSTTSSISVTKNGLFHVTYTDPVTGCSSVSDEEAITFLSLPTEPIISIDGVLCEGQDITLTTQYAEVTWYKDGIAETLSENYAVTSSGLYKAEYTEGSTGCKNNSEENIFINSKPNAPVIELQGPNLITVPLQIVNWLDDQGNVLHTGDTYQPVDGEGKTFTAVFVDANNCTSDPSNEVVYYYIGINEIVSAGFKIQPNPVKTEMTVFVDLEAYAGEYKLTDLSGRMVKIMFLTKGENKVNLSELDAGVYVLQNKSGSTIKLIKD